MTTDAMTPERRAAIEAYIAKAGPNEEFGVGEMQELFDALVAAQNDAERMRTVYDAALAWRAAPLIDKGRSTGTWTNALRDLEQACDIALKREKPPSSRSRLFAENLILLKLYEAARAWRAGRDRDKIGTAPPGGPRSATGRALIDAIDQTAAKFEALWKSATKTD